MYILDIAFSQNIQLVIYFTKPEKFNNNNIAFEKKKLNVTAKNKAIFCMPNRPEMHELHASAPS